MKATVNEPSQCPSCGKPTPAGALAGFCPACLLARGADTDAGGGRFEPPPLAEVARLFPRLEILDLLGAGGMGAVYKARQPALDRIVALKILPSQNARGVNFTERFNREARALARLSHPNIVAVHEFGQAGALSYFIMEFVDGANLRLLEQGSRLSPREALQIIPQICDALQYAHDEGVVHRDIKPENVLVDRKGRVKIADFGLAKILGTDAESLRLTAEGQVMGTPHYMAPEQVEKPLCVDHRADIYALGVVFYEMLTGDLPLGKFAPPSRKVQVDVRLDDVVLRALENDPARRYQKAIEVKSQVETIAGTPAPAVTPAAEPAPEPAFVRCAGFPLVRERDGRRKLNWMGVVKLLGVTFGVLTIAFALISLAAGETLFGWFGISGTTSLKVRLQVAVLVTIWGVWRAWSRRDRPVESPALPRTPQGTVILPPEKFSRKATVGAIWVPLFLIAIVLGYLSLGPALTGVSNPPDRGWPWGRGLSTLLILLPGLVAPFGTTILGWMAVGDIRRSRGRISGLPLALFDGLLFPLLALDAFLAISLSNLWQVIINSNANAGGLPPGTWHLLGAATVFVCLLVDFLIVRRVWRAVRLTGDAPRADGDWWWSSKQGAIAIGLACVGVIALTAGRNGSPANLLVQQTAQRDAQTGRLAVKLPGRGVVELLAIGEAGAALNGWWTPVGTPVSNSLYEVRGALENRSSGRIPKDFLFRAKDLPEGASHVGTEADPASGCGSGGEVFLSARRVQGGWQARFGWEPSVRSASVRLGYALDPWRTIVTQDAASQSHQQIRLPTDPYWKVNFHHSPADTKDGAQVAVVFGPENRLWTHRMVAVDTNGVEHGYSQGDATPIEKLTLWTYTFRNLPLAAVKEFRLQVRPVHWIEFRDVALAPNAPLPEPVRARFGPATEVTFDEVIDFDTGVVTNFPPDRGGPNPFHNLVNLQWMRQRGFDAGAGASELWPVDMDFVVLDLPDWDDLRESELVERIYQSHFRPGQLKGLAEGRLPATYGFRTREGSLGILQLVAFADGRPGATVRYKLRESSAAKTTKLEIGNGAKLTFGPMQERSFAEFIDFDTGQTAQLPEGDDANFNPFEVTPALLSWMQENGLDAHAGAGKIETLGVSIVDLAPSDWDSLQPEALVTRLRDSGRFQMQLEPGLEGLPATFGFRTREGGTGLLQIVSFEKRKAGATVRFKLISRSSPQ